MSEKQTRGSVARSGLESSLFPSSALGPGRVRTQRSFGKCSHWSERPERWGRGTLGHCMVLCVPCFWGTLPSWAPVAPPSGELSVLESLGTVSRRMCFERGLALRQGELDLASITLASWM